MNTSPGSALLSCPKKPVYADGSSDDPEEARNLRRKLNSIRQEEFLRIRDTIKPRQWRALKKYEKASILRWYSYSLISLGEEELEAIAAEEPNETLKHPSIIRSLNPEILRKCILTRPEKALGNKTARTRMGKEGIPTVEECFDLLTPAEFTRLFRTNREILLETVRTTKRTNWLLKLLSQTKTPWHKAVVAEGALKI